MMLYGLALVVFLGSACGMPLEMDEAMRDLAIADIDVTNFYSAIEKNNFGQLPELYSKLNVERPKLHAALAKLQRTDPGRGLQSLKRLLDIQLDTVLFRINGLLPPMNGGGSEQPQNPLHMLSSYSARHDVNTPEEKSEKMPDGKPEKITDDKHEKKPEKKHDKIPDVKPEQKHEKKPEKNHEIMPDVKHEKKLGKKLNKNIVNNPAKKEHHENNHRVIIKQKHH